MQEVQLSPNRIKAKRTTPGHIIVKIKTFREKMTHYVYGSLSKVNSWLSSETVGTRKQWDDIFKVLREKNCLSRILYPTRVSFKK